MRKGIQVKFSCIACSFAPQPESVMSSPFNKGVMYILCSRFVNCLNLSSHCLGVNTGFPSVALVSRFGTIFFSVMVSVC